MTVNEKKRGRPSKKQQQLNADSILAVAKKLMKRNGKAPSIRLLASELEIDPMAIYYYYANKNALLEALTTSLVDEIYLPQENTPWREDLKRLSMSYVELLMEYNGLLETILTMSSYGPAQVFNDRYYKIISPLILDNKTQEDGLGLLVDYLHGFAFAKSCCHDGRLLNVDRMDGSLSLVFNSLERATQKL
ncbi:TetR/AcrR family transcriptional regulator [Marinomonas sp.]|uniref:TetR/AcrR family transcriptional regulator n=1 Tax=Marinomonas sp. TaxID=1904862 RepID=UPI003BABC40D